jgi:hypothetical protein
MITKLCKKCDTTKPLDAFHDNPLGTYNKNSYCKLCTRKSALKSARVTNKLRCYVGREYIKRTHPFYVAGKRFKDWDECYAYWTQKSGIDFTHLTKNKDVEYEEASVSNKGFVYIIYNPAFEGWYKIGKADNLEARLRTYQTGDPHRAYKVCYEVEFEDCRAAENAVKVLLQDDDKIILKNEWVMTAFDRIRNIINEVKREEDSPRHRNEQPSQSHLVLCN